MESSIIKDFLCHLISTPSISGEEGNTAVIIESFLKEMGCTTFRKGNNVWVQSIIDEQLPVILLNSHHDTVKPVVSWTRDPFTPIIENGRLYGLGSNDAGASLVSLMTRLPQCATQNDFILWRRSRIFQKCFFRFFLFQSILRALFFQNFSSNKHSIDLWRFSTIVRDMV